MGQTWNYLRGGNLENVSYYLLDCPSCILQPRKKIVNTLPCFLQLPLSRHTQEFWICLFKSHFLLESGSFDIFEIMMVSKILHFYIFCFLYSQYEFLNFFSNFRSQHRHTSFLPKHWYIMDIHHKKWKISMFLCWLLTLATPTKNKVLKIDPTLNVII